MTIEQSYLTFLQIINRNYTNDNISVDRARFILWFNNIQNRYVEWILEKRNEDDLRDVQVLLEFDKQLSNSGKSLNHYNFTLPDNYFNFSNIQIFAEKGSCKKLKLFSFEVKNDDVEEYLADVFNKPSFIDQETFYTLGSNKVVVYYDNFIINDVYLTYYRYPKQVDILGYEKLDGSNSSNIDPEFDDKVINRILFAMAKEYSATNDELNKYNIDKDRLFSEI